MLDRFIRNDHGARHEIVENIRTIAALTPMVRGDQNISANKLGVEVRTLQQRSPTYLLQIAGEIRS
jgi:hypothetical protein